MPALHPALEALKHITRLQWMLHFEAIATVGNDEDSLAWMGGCEPADVRRVH